MLRFVHLEIPFWLAHTQGLCDWALQVRQNPVVRGGGRLWSNAAHVASVHAQNDRVRVPRGVRVDQVAVCLEYTALRQTIVHAKANISTEASGIIVTYIEYGQCQEGTVPRSK